MRGLFSLMVPIALALATPLQAKTAKVGQPAPDFSVKTLTGETIDLASLRGKVVVINLWATWCVPCRAEFVMLDKYSRLRTGTGLVILAIETGGAIGAKSMLKVAEAASFPVALSRNAKARDYRTIDGAVPTNYIIDRAGMIRYAKAGSFAFEELDQLMVPLLNERVPAAASMPRRTKLAAATVNGLRRNRSPRTS